MKLTKITLAENENNYKCSSCTAYIILDDVDENKEVLKKYEEVREGIKKEIKTINGGKKIEYRKKNLKN